MSAALRLLLAASRGGGGFLIGDDVSLGWFNVKSYGATGDGTTDDTSAINAAIAAWNSAGKGLLYFPTGTYKVTSALTTITASGTVLGNGMGTWSSTLDAIFGASSLIICTSTTADLFTITSDVHFALISLQNTAGSTPSAGSAIHVAGTDYRQHFTAEFVFIVGFYDGMDVQINSTATIHGCSIWNPIRYGIRIRNTVNTDSGGATISDCAIVSQTQGASAGIRIESSGGNKIVGTNINNIGTRGIDLAAAADSSILLISACSIENYTGDGIHLDGNGHAYRLISVNGCQFGQYGNSSGKAIYATGVDDISITGILAVANSGTPTVVSLNSGTKGYIGPIVNDGFGTLVATSSFTSLDDDSGGA